MSKRECWRSFRLDVFGPTIKTPKKRAAQDVRVDHPKSTNCIRNPLHKFVLAKSGPRLRQFGKPSIDVIAVQSWSRHHILSDPDRSMP
jgi:hypothetical protein